jgi:hypothetical protein
VGEPLEVEVTVRHPAGAEFLLPSGASLEPFELLERSEEPSGSPTESRIRLSVAAYRLPGAISFPALRIEYREAEGKLTSVETEAIPIELVTSLTPDVTDIHDLKPPIEDLPVPSRWGLLWWLLAALAAALALYLLYRKLRRKKRETRLEAPPRPLQPPEEEAEAALRRLAAARLLEQGRFDEYYTALAEIMKRYAGRRFEVPYLERTTTEIASDLRFARVRDEWCSELSVLLDASDLVKFARGLPEREEAQRMLPRAFRWVAETRPRPAAAPPEARA